MKQTIASILISATRDIFTVQEEAIALASEKTSYWKSERDLYEFSDGSRLLVDSNFAYELTGKSGDAVAAMLDARESGVERVWYGNVENAEPVSIEDAIRDILLLGDDSLCAFDWGVWNEEGAR